MIISDRTDPDNSESQIATEVEQPKPEPGPKEDIVEKFVADTADDIEYEAGEIGRAGPKQGDMAEANLREVPILDDVHDQENDPVRVDATAEEIVH